MRRPLGWILLAPLWGGGCPAGPEPLGELPAVRGLPSEPMSTMVVVHGGQGSPASRSGPPAAAAEAVLAALEAGRTPMDAAVAGIVVLEDHPDFNAGIGANLRLDGKTIQTDAAIMDDSGRFGAVAGLEHTKNPVLAARAVADGPHSLLAGEGAQAFADRLGLQRAELRTEQARKRLARGIERLAAGQTPDPAWATFDWRAVWNFPDPPPVSIDDLAAQSATTPSSRSLSDDGRKPVGPHGKREENVSAVANDTVGVVLRTSEGRFVAALSTGGTTLALRGRVGDVPQFGAGLFAGSAGAVAATGKGEAITREQVAVEVYRLLEHGEHPDRAIARVIRSIDAAEGVGVIALSRRGFAARATSQMAWAMSERGPTSRTIRADGRIP